MSAVCIIELWYTLITVKSLQWSMRIVDQSAAFWSGYVEISNKTIETDPNVLLSESMIRDRGEMFREWSALTTEDIIDCSKTEEQWGMSDLRKDLKASTQMVSYIWIPGNIFFYHVGDWALSQVAQKGFTVSILGGNSQAAWTLSGATCCIGGPGWIGEVRPGDPQRSLPTSTPLWFCFNSRWIQLVLS